MTTLLMLCLRLVFAFYLGVRGTLNVLVVLLPVLGGVIIHFAGYLPVFALVAAVMFAASFLLNGRAVAEG